MTLAVTSKTHAEDLVARSTYTTASITVPVDSVAILVVNGYNTTFHSLITPTLSSTALSGITTLGSSFHFTSSFGYWTSLYWGTGTGSAGTVSIPWGVQFDRSRWIVLQVSPDAGGSVSVRQGVVGIGFDDTASNPATVTLSALATGSAVVSGEGFDFDTSAITQASGYTEVFEVDDGNVRQHAQYRLDPVSATVTASNANGAGNWWMGAVEVLEVLAAPLGFLPVGF